MPLERARIETIFDRMPGRTILVLGDLMLDRYIWGTVERISPEAPVPVLNVTREEAKLGGAGNVANNLQALKATVKMASVIGQDRQGEYVRELLECQGIPTSHILAASQRQTIVKTRVIAQHQQVVRIDREDKDGLSPELIDELIESVRTSIEAIDAVIVSDYDKGIVCERLMRELSELCTAHSKPLCVDTKDRNFPYYRDVTLITPNKRELAIGAGLKIQSEADVIAAALKLKAELNCRYVLATRGEEGMSLFEQDAITHIPTAAKKVFDVTGAGDTVIATFTLALTAGATPQEAAYIANAAAGLTVAEVGAASVPWERLRALCLEEALG
ncbi:MAG: Bifunctional protein HldE [Deltaproteobacteria bacterium ADurb.Bin510]|nr:MAG: Bifunctional protein HldE [Deltaproteobacteria bacterium ADurb.Bin510]